MVDQCSGIRSAAREVLQYGRLAFLKTVHVLRLVVGCSVLPTAVEDSDPFES